MSSAITKKIKSNARHQLAALVLRGDVSDPRVKEILQGSTSHATRIGFSGKPNTAGFSPSFGTIEVKGGQRKTLLVNFFINKCARGGRGSKPAREQKCSHKMTRAWAENLAGQWLNANRRDDTPFVTSFSR